MEKFYSIPEVAKIIGVHTSTVFRWVKAGNLNSFHFSSGVHNKIAHRDVVKLLESHDLPLDRIEIVENKRVLVIDDDENILDMTKNAIKKILGYEVQTEKYGIRAGYMIKAFSPHVLLVDNVVSDGMSEKEFIDMVRSDRDLKNTKIVKFTAADMTSEQAKERGFDSVLKKHIASDEIANSIESMIG